MEKPASLTAMISAYYRARHATHDDPKIFEDSLARALFTDDEYASLGHNLALALPVFAPEQAASCSDEETAVARVMRAQGAPVVLSRARYTEDNLEAAVCQGVRQYVILGAGMDTFAYRRSDRTRDLAVFEIDHPAMQAFKRSRLAELAWEVPEGLHFVPVDFARDSLVHALEPSPYDPQVPSFFSWLGVTYYLEDEVVRTTLRMLASLAPSGSFILFDYLDTAAFDPERASPGLQTLHQVMQRAGEPLKTGLDPLTLGAELEGLGLRLRESLAPRAIQERFFQGRTDGYRALEHYHFAWAEVL